MNKAGKYILYCGLLLSGCTQRKQNKTVEFNFFEIDIPSEWIVKKEKGIDSQVIYLITAANDSILLEIGKNVTRLSNIVPVAHVDSISLFKDNGILVEDISFSYAPEIDENQGIFHKEYYYYDTINNNIGKLQIPKKTGKGSTSVNFDAIYNNTSVTITGRNLDSLTQNNLIKVFYSLRLK